MSDFETTAHALRRWAAQMDASDRAAEAIAQAVARALGEDRQ